MSGEEQGVQTRLETGRGLRDSVAQWDTGCLEGLLLSSFGWAGESSGCASPVGSLSPLQGRLICTLTSTGPSTAGFSSPC